MTAPVIIGLDLSLASTGLYDDDGGATIKTAAAHPIESRLQAIRETILNRILGGLVRPDLAVVEDLPKHVAHGATQLGMVHGVVRVALREAGIPFVLVPPANLKKYVSGRGNAPKADMRMATFKRFDVDLADDNICDAHGLRAMALDAYGHALVEMPATNRAALESIAWPVHVHQEALS